MPDKACRHRACSAIPALGLGVGHARYHSLMRLPAPSQSQLLRTSNEGSLRWMFSMVAAEGSLCAPAAAAPWPCGAKGALRIGVRGRGASAQHACSGARMRIMRACMHTCICGLAWPHAGELPLNPSTPNAMFPPPDGAQHAPAPGALTGQPAARTRALPPPTRRPTLSTPAQAESCSPEGR